MQVEDGPSDENQVETHQDTQSVLEGEEFHSVKGHFKSSTLTDTLVAYTALKTGIIRDNCLITLGST